MKKILSILLALVLVLPLFSLVCFGEEATNLISAENSTFESGTNTWEAFFGGTLKVTDNPSGEGKVLEYTTLADKTKTWASLALDLRPVIQNYGKSGTYYLNIDIFCEKSFPVQPTIRTENQNLDLAKNEGNDYPRLGTVITDEGNWITFSCEFEITDDDLEVKEGKWLLCFDGITKNCDKFYIDNVILSDEEIESGESENLPEKTAITRSDKTLIGTIRWDAFVKSTPDGTDPASQVARVLSPAKYHNQAPFFASVESDGTVSFPEYTVDIWEKEAEYAVNGGLDYFAYLWYDSSDPMSQPRKTHLLSSKKDTIKMCGILGSLRDTVSMNELYGSMKDSCYLRLNGRPVLFLYGIDSWSDADIQTVRTKAVKAGIEEALYIVGMDPNKNSVTKTVKRDIDAISWYSVNATKKDMPYAELAESNDRYMNILGSACKGGDADLVPSFTAGRDTRARIETGVSWVEGDPNAVDDAMKPYKNLYALPPTIDELKAEIKSVLDYMLVHKDVTTPNLVCSYGWNEHEEGGWLCPTLECDENGNPIKDANGNNKANTERLDALKEVVDAYRAKEASGETPAPDVTDAPDVTETPGTTDTKGGFNALWVIIPAAVVVIGGGAAAAVVVKKKKKLK